MLTNLEVRALESLCSMSRAVCEIRDMLRDSSDAPAEDSPNKVDRLRAFVRELCECLKEEAGNSYDTLIERALEAVNEQVL